MIPQVPLPFCFVCPYCRQDARGVPLRVKPQVLVDDQKELTGTVLVFCPDCTRHWLCQMEPETHQRYQHDLRCCEATFQGLQEAERLEPRKAEER